MSAPPFSIVDDDPVQRRLLENVLYSAAVVHLCHLDEPGRPGPGIGHSSLYPKLREWGIDSEERRPERFVCWPISMEISARSGIYALFT